MLGRLHLEDPIEAGAHPSPAVLILPVQEPPALLAFSSSGRVALLRWEFAAQQPGGLASFLPDSLDGETIVQVLPLNSGSDESIGLLSSDGRFKRLPSSEFQELSGRAATILKLKDGVDLRRVVNCREGEDLIVASSVGRMLRLTINDSNLPLMGRAAQGPMLMRLLPGESVVGAATTTDEGSVIVATAAGQIKRLAVRAMRSCQRGDLGQIGLRFQQRDDVVVDLQGLNQGVMAALLSSGDSLRFNPMTMVDHDEHAPGDLLPLKPGSKLESLIPLINQL